MTTNLLRTSAFGFQRLVCALIVGGPLSLASLAPAGMQAVQSAEGQPAREAAAWKDAGWPRQFETETHVVRVHQPQVDEWPKFDRIRFRSAITVAPKGQDDPTYGILVVSADTRVAFEERLVALSDRRVESIEFPGVEPASAELLRKIVLEAAPPQRTMTVSLDRIIAELNLDATQIRTSQVAMEPPRIFSSDKPAVLVMFLGKPRFRAVGDTGLMAAVNTNWDLFLDPSTGTHYLLFNDSWLTTSDLTSTSWKPTGRLPDGFSKLPADDNWSDVRAAIPGKPPTEVPSVIVTHEPAELVVTSGPPEMEPVPGTKLMLVTNTESDLFYKTDEKRFYLLAAGRWFRADSLGGPWSAASASLPDDFKRIPEDSEAGEVLASVPGTTAANEAVILASIPNKAVVNKSEVTLKVKYTGQPDFRPIEDTVVRYAYNSPYSVFLVNGRYYCCHNAVWFESAAPTGAWSVCTSVPPEIYTIPPSSPKYNVTYVTVYESTPTTVTTGYTAGYTGAQVAATGAVMFGLGILVGDALDDDDDCWSFHYHSGFYSYGCGAIYHHNYGGYVCAGRRYGPYGGAGGFAAYNPATGAWARGAYAYGPRGAAGVRAGYNPSTGYGGYRAGATTPYGSWSRGAVTNGDDWVRAGSVSGPRGSAGGVQGSGGGSLVHAENRFGNGVTVGKSGDGDIYAGKDGNVYQRTENGWEQQTPTTPKQTTQGAGKPADRAKPDSTAATRAKPSAEQAGYLQRESAARERGDQTAKRASSSSRSRGTGRGRAGGGR